MGGNGTRMRWAKDKDGQGITVNVPLRENLLNDLDERLRAGRGFTLATLNLDHVAKLGQLPDFARAYRSHSHVTADGNPIVWLSRLAGQRVELIPGSELVVPVAALAAESGVPVALLGATDEALSGASATLEARFPHLRIVARIAPAMGFDPAGPEADDCIARLRASGAGLCFIALGAPKQEIFAARASSELPHMGFLSIGAGLDFLSGRQRRAPKVMRLVAAEWLWRLALNPRRLAGRYAHCILILPRLFHQALSIRFRRIPGEA